MFKIYKKSGFHMTFENGYTISVQFNWSSYCANHCRDIKMPDVDYRDLEEICGVEGSPNAEIAIISPEDELIEIPEWENEVKGYCSANEVLKWMNYCANLPKD